MTATDWGERTGLSTAITATGLTKSFVAGRRRSRRLVEAVRDISFTVARGERIAYIGPNGAGKSTSIKAVSVFWLGLRRYTSTALWTRG